MIQFRSDHVRTAFHKLPAESQLIWEAMGAKYRTLGQYLHIDDIIHDCGISEIVIRIDEELHVSPGSSNV